MRIDFSRELNDLKGNPLPSPTGEESANLTLAMTCIQALIAVYDDEPNISGEEKVKRFTLATAIYAAKEPLDLKVEDVAMVKRLVAKGYGPLVVGQAWKMLDPVELAP